MAADETKVSRATAARKPRGDKKTKSAPEVGAQQQQQQQQSAADPWAERKTAAQTEIEQLDVRYRAQGVGLPIGEQMRIRDDAIRIFWQQLISEGRLTQGEVEARVTENMLHHYRAALPEALRRMEHERLTGTGGRGGVVGGGAGLDNALARGAAGANGQAGPLIVPRHAKTANGRTVGTQDTREPVVVDADPPQASAASEKAH